MVSFEEIQTVYYMVAATGVLIAAVFYVMNLQETRSNRTLTFTTNISQRQLSEDWQRKMTELLHMEWSSFEDFRSKYDSQVNPDNYVKRNMILGTFDFMGFMLKRGLVDREVIYQVSGEMIIMMWMKFNSVISEYRRVGDYAADTFSNFEYLAYEMARMKKRVDPSWVIASIFSKSDYERAFAGKP